MKKTICSIVACILIVACVPATSNAVDIVHKWKKITDDKTLLKVISEDGGLNDPSSVQLKDVSVDNHPSPDGSVTTLWCGRINAKDFYGKYVGFRRFYVLGNNDENTVTIENPKDKYSTCIINDVCEGSSINKY